MRISGFLLLALLPATAAAQSGTTPPAAGSGAEAAQILTLEDAIRIARENSPGYRRSLNDADVAQANVRMRFFDMLPSLSGSLSTSASGGRQILGTDDFNRPIQRSFYSQNSRSSYSASLSLTVFDGGQSLRNYRNAKDGLRGTEASVRQAELSLITNVTTQYLAAARVARLLEVEQRNVQNAQDRLERANSEYALAVASRADLLRAEQSLLDARQRYNQSEAQAYKARLTLWQALGMEGEPVFSVDAALPEIFDPADLDVDALIARAAAENPAIVSAQVSLAQQERNLTTQRWTQYLPRVTLGFNYNGGITSGDDYSRFLSVSDMSRGYTTSINMSLPLFNTVYQHIQGQPGLVQPQIAVEDAELSLREQRLVVANDVRQRLVDLQIAYDAVQAAQEKASLATQILDLSEEEYRLGSLSYINYEQVINQEADARRAVVDAQFDFFTQRTALERVLGGPLTN